MEESKICSGGKSYLMVSRSTTKNTWQSQNIPSKTANVFHTAILLKQSQTEMDDVINVSRMR